MHKVAHHIKLILGHGLGPISNLLIAFYLSEFLDKESYASFMTIISLILVVFGFNAKSAIQRKLNLSYTKVINIQNWINLLWLPLIVCLTYSLYPEPNIILSLCVWFYCSSELVLERLRYDLDLNRYLFWRFVKIVLDIILFISISQSELLVYSRTVSMLISSGLLLLFLHKYVIPTSIRFSIKEIYNHVRLGLGMLTYAVSMILFSLSDRLVMDYYKEEAYYTYFLMSSAGSVHMMIGSSLAPYFMFLTVNSKGEHRSRSNFLIYIHLLVYLVSFAVLFFLDHHEFVLLNNLWIAYFTILSFGGIFQAYYIQKVQVFVGNSAYKTLIVIVAPVTVVAFILNVLLVPVYGAMASALILLIGSICLLYRLHTRVRDID